MASVKPIPEGFRTITPSLAIDGAAEAIELYKKALGATEDYRMAAADGKKIMHACLTVGDSKLFLSDLFPEMGCGEPSQGGFYLYVKDIDASFAQACKAGLTEKYAPADMFWGDRTGSVTDKFGIVWTFSTHVRDVSEEDMKKGAEEMNKGKKAA